MQCTGTNQLFGQGPMVSMLTCGVQSHVQFIRLNEYHSLRISRNGTTTVEDTANFEMFRVPQGSKLGP